MTEFFPFFETEPFKHQLDVFNRSCLLENFGLFLETGTGKTKIAIDTAALNFTEKRIDAVVVLAPKGTYGIWFYNEIPKHCPVDYRMFLWRGFHYTDEKEQFNNALKKDGRLTFFIANIDAVTTPKFNSVFLKFVDSHPKFMFVIDESTKIKNWKSKRTKAVTKLAPKAVMRRILSGFPITQSPLDLYSQCNFLKPGILGHNSVFSFNNRYAIKRRHFYGPRTFVKIDGYQFLDELSNKVKTFSSVLRKEDCLDLPPKMYRTIEVELTEIQQKYYDELLQRAFTYIDEHEITAINALSLITRLLQITCGQIKLGDKKYASIENNRIQTLVDLVDETQGHIVVWTTYVRTATDIINRLGNEAVLLPGNLNPQERENRIESFRRSEHRVLVANPASSGHGITLTEASTVIYYSNSYNLEHRLQSEDRTHRIGQTKSVMYTDLQSPKTIEPRIVEALKQKKKIADMVINSKGLREFLLT